MMCSTNVKLGSADVVQLKALGSAEPRWLYVLDTDWSDLIEISDVTRTVYISFDVKERPQLANVCSQLSATFFFALIL